MPTSHQMSFTKDNEITNIPINNTTQGQNELDIKSSNHLWCDNLRSAILDTKLTSCPVHGSTFIQSWNQDNQG